MKLTAVMMLSACLTAAANGHSQNISLTGRNLSLEKCFSLIERQTDYVFFYNDGMLDNAAKVTSIDIRNGSIVEVLSLLLREQPLDYLIRKKTIFIVKKRTSWQQANIEDPDFLAIDVRGRVVDEAGEPVAGASVQVRGDRRKGGSTDAAGYFELKGVDENATLLITGVNIETQERKVNGKTDLGIIVAKIKVAQGTEVAVTVNTGYQQLPKERATGSFVQIDSGLLNRRVGYNIVDRLDGIASGLIFNRNRKPAANESAIIIRGRSTLFASPNPLIVVDNFPYDGDINNINPNDIENITLLRDAAAASIWGVRSGNGVIVITTKKGKAGQSPKISVNSSLTLGERPDLWYQPMLAAPDYVAMESFLFSKGYYNWILSIPYAPISPATEIFYKRKAGLISAADSASQIAALMGNDVRNDLYRFFYRGSAAQQYSLSLSGGSATNQYYVSAGYDRGLSDIVNDSRDRVTLRVKNDLQLVPAKLEFTTDINFSATKTHSANGLNSAFNGSFPVYSRLVDDNGGALAVYTRTYRRSWVDTIGQGQLLDWNYRPYDELSLSNITTSLVDYRILNSLRYTIRKGWSVNLSYQYEKGSSDVEDLENKQTFYARDLINQFSQPNYTTKEPLRRIPLGSIVDNSTFRYSSHNVRAITNYSTTIAVNHRLDIIAGWEMKDFGSASSSYRRYGYNPENGTNIAVDLVNRYPVLPSGFSSQIPDITRQNGTTDRYLSYFANAGYTWLSRYLINLSARRDESNLFGVNANQKGVPLWSTGLGWIVSKETFFKILWISYLKLRATYGYNGNVDKSTTAYTTAGVGYGGSIFNQPFAYLINPPNPDLSWEKIGMVNLGGDFSLLQNRLSGSIEYFMKKGRNLIGNSPVASQTGVSQFRQNIANISTRGWDVTITAKLLEGRFSWVTTFLYSYAADRVDRYLVKAPQVKYYLPNITFNPLEGKSWSAVFAYKWAGLSAVNGDPQGILDGAISNNYTKLTNPRDLNELVYIGPGRPTSFGSFRNDFTYRRFGLSLNVVYQLGYYYRKPAVSYTNTFGSSGSGGRMANGDIARRWQKPGDENSTNVPSMTYPAVYARDDFYEYSEVLVEKGDHVRLRDVRLDYNCPAPKPFRNRVRSIRCYLYANNIGIIWRANHSRIDPDNITGYPTPRTLAAGIAVEF